MKKQLTVAVIRAAECKGKTREFVYDTASAGLVLYITPAGSRAFYAHYPSPVTGSEGRMKLGDWKQFDGQPGLTLEEARDANRRAQFIARTERRDPKIEAEKAAEAERARIEAERVMSEEGSLAVLAQEFIGAKRLTAGTSGFRSADIYERVLAVAVLPKLGSKPAAEVTDLDIETLLEALVTRGVPGRARTVRTVLSALFKWAVSSAKWRNMGVRRNVVRDVRGDLTGKPKPSERKLTDQELKELWEAVEACTLGIHVKSAFKLTMLLGERSTELIEAPWSEFVDLDGDNPRWVLPAERHKGKTEKIIPLPKFAVSILQELRESTESTGWLIPCRLTAAQTRNERPAHTGLLIGALRHFRTQGLLTLADFSPHDLRRTMAHRMVEELEVPGEVVSSILGHARQGVTATTYTQPQFVRMKRAALEAWSQRLQQIVGLNVTSIEASNVVRLPVSA